MGDKLTGGVIFLVVGGIFIFLMTNLRSDPIIEKQQMEFEETVSVKILAELEKGAYFQRVIDKELGKVCYINAVGGGIQCFPLEEITIDMTSEEIKKLTKVYIPPTRYNY